MINDLFFEWDDEKPARNVEKHQVSFEEAVTVFDDPIHIMFLDEEHSLDEERYITLGLSTQGRLLMLAHTEREGRIRIISAQVATKKEQKFYAEAN